MSQTKTSAFSLKVGPQEEDALALTAFTGTEELSRPFDFQVEFLPMDDKPLDPAELLGKTARLGIQVAKGATRYVHGFVHRVEALGLRGGFPRYRVRVVPEFERLMHVRRSRIFQEKSTADIVKKVLSEAGVEHRWAAGGRYAPREYCVQYRETDFAFVSRLLEWEGCFYFFEHSAEKHVMVLADDASAFTAMPDGAALPFRERKGQVPREEHVSVFALSQQVRPAAMMTRDFDFKKPSLDLTAEVEGGDFTGLEVYDYAEGYVAPGEGKRLVKVRLQEAQREARTFEGEAACPRLCPGFLFELEDPAPAGTAGKYLPVQVRHRGWRPEAPGSQPVLEDGLYRTEVSCLPEGTPFRPRRRIPRPVVPGIQTATVVGPSGEEIHPEGHGRIKVQFHWDREGQRNEKSSCWIRVGQVWGGPAWGGLFLPRMGQEVVVRFLEGDPDRPLITGAVYNGENTTPYSLPDEKTKSTLKSNSSLGGNGSNEFRLEDAAGQEEIFVHGQKDETLVTENDKTQQVHGYEDLLVEKNRKKTVEGNQRLAVSLDDAGQIGGHQSLRVELNRSTTTDGMHSEEVEENQSVTVGKNWTALILQTGSELIGAAKALTVGGGYAINVAAMSSESVGEMKSVQVAGNDSEIVAGHRDERVDKDKQVKVSGDWDSHIRGRLALTFGKDVTDTVKKDSMLWVKEQPANALAKSFALKADKFSLVVGGHLILSMEKSGKVALNVKTFTLNSSSTKVKGSKVKLDAAGSLVDKSVKMKELKDIDQAKPSTVEFVLKDTDGNPVKNQPFELHLSDGTIKKGTLDGSGKGKVEDVPTGDYRIVFPKLGGRVNKGL